MDIVVLVYGVDRLPGTSQTTVPIRNVQGQNIGSTLSIMNYLGLTTDFHTWHSCAKALSSKSHEVFEFGKRCDASVTNDQIPQSAIQIQHSASVLARDYDNNVRVCGNLATRRPQSYPIV